MGGRLEREPSHLFAAPGDEDLLRSRGVAVEVVQDHTCIRLMREFIHAHPQLWTEDIGV